MNESGDRDWGMNTRDVRRVIKLAPGSRITKHKTTPWQQHLHESLMLQFLFVSNTALSADLNTQSNGFYFQNNSVNFR